MQKLFTTQWDREVSSLVQKPDECGSILTKYLLRYSEFLKQDANSFLWTQYSLKIIEIGDRLVTIVQKLFTTQWDREVSSLVQKHDECGSILTKYLLRYSEFLKQDANSLLWTQYSLKVIEILSL